MKTKQLFLLFIAIIMVNGSFAQVGDQGFNYKALITQNGNALANQTVNIQFTLTYTGTIQYQETQSATTDDNGILSVMIGGGTATTGTFQNLYWGFYYLLKVEIDTGSGYQDFGENLLRYVPKAKWADKAANADSVDFSNITNMPASLSDGDDDTHLTDAQIAAMGYIKNANDADHSTTNEIQNLSLSGTQLSISSGNRVNFTGWDNNAADDFSGNYADLSSKPDVFRIYGTTNAATAYSSNIQHHGNLLIESGLLDIKAPNAALLLENGTHKGKFSRFTNRLYIGSNDMIQMGCNGDVRTDLAINHSGDVDINKNLKVGNATNNVSVKVVAGDDNISKLQLFEQGNYGFELEYDGANDELNLWSKHFTGNEAKRTTWKKNGEVEINGKITSESSRNNADLKAFAYGNIYWTIVNNVVTKTTPNSTNNFNVYLDSTGVYQIRLYDENGVEIPFDFNDFTVIATAYEQEPIIISTHKYSNRLYFKLYNASTSNLYTGNLSFVIYRK